MHKQKMCACFAHSRNSGRLKRQAAWKRSNAGGKGNRCITSLHYFCRKITGLSSPPPWKKNFKRARRNQMTQKLSYGHTSLKWWRDSCVLDTREADTRGAESPVSGPRPQIMLARQCSYRISPCVVLCFSPGVVLCVVLLSLNVSRNSTVGKLDGEPP